jgi:glycosyltransferase involved in cell wall biosynthesis
VVEPSTNRITSVFGLAQLICFNCGVLVLATRVGGIPDVITDGETGFILEDNSPEGIAEGVSRIMDNQNLTLIVGQAEKVVEKEYRI